MSLYPIVILTPSEASIAPNLIMPGNLIVIPLDMTTIQMTSIDLQQVSNTQDYSMRAWLSVYQNGAPLPSSDGVSGIFPIIKFSLFPIIIYIESQTPPANSFPILVTPGLYNLNILNLTNERNVFNFSQTNLA